MLKSEEGMGGRFRDPRAKPGNDEKQQDILENPVSNETPLSSQPRENVQSIIKPFVSPSKS